MASGRSVIGGNFKIVKKEKENYTADILIECFQSYKCTITYNKMYLHFGMNFILKTEVYLKALQTTFSLNQFNKINYTCKLKGQIYILVFNMCKQDFNV